MECAGGPVLPVRNRTPFHFLCPFPCCVVSIFVYRTPAEKNTPSSHAPRPLNQTDPFIKGCNRLPFNVTSLGFSSPEALPFEPQLDPAAANNLGKLVHTTTPFHLAYASINILSNRGFYVGSRWVSPGFLDPRLFPGIVAATLFHFHRYIQRAF
jgi:hypothetical protein